MIILLYFINNFAKNMFMRISILNIILTPQTPQNIIIHLNNRLFIRITTRPRIQSINKC